MNIGQSIRQRLVTGVNGGIGRTRYWIVGIPGWTRIFINNAGPRMTLPGQMLELGYPGVFEIVRIVHHPHRLMPFTIERAMPELQ
jgi:hypothetical protein